MVQSQFRQQVPVRSFKVSESWVRQFSDQVLAEDRYAIEYAAGSPVMTPVGLNGQRSLSLDALRRGVLDAIETRRDWLRETVLPLASRAAETVRQQAAAVRANR